MDQLPGRKHDRSSSSEVHRKSSFSPDREEDLQKPVKKRKIEKSVIQGMDFGQQPPPIYKSIKDLLKRYPNGQIFKELIQNADDAGATVVKFYIDNRHHKSRALPNENLSEYQGPALIAANDAIFAEKDWKGIQRLQVSIKADDPFSVGKFGIGFNSVYHITDVPSIISGDRIAYLDPQERMWPEKRGMMFKLSDLYGSDALIPFSGIEGFNHDTTFKYPKTLFRFPLRNKPSVISEYTYSPESIIELIEVLKDEANFLLLFLQSVHTIAVKTITPNSKCRLLFQVQVSPDLQQSVIEKRKSFQSKLHTAHELNPYKISSCISNVLRLSIDKTQQPGETTCTSWLVANQVGSTNEEVLKAASEQRTFPWVGVAIELHEDDALNVPSDGRIFCFLPLPIEVTSTLPVHVNGTFGLNDDRRAIKWPEKDRKNDKTAQWNQMLMRDCLPSCYNLLLKNAIKGGIITPKYLYSILPEINIEAPWSSILETFYTFLFQWKWLRAVEYNEWVGVKEATITSEGDKLPKVVRSVLIDCGRKVVEVPDKIYEALENFSSSFTMVSEKIVRDELRANLSKYNTKAFEEKLVLLGYCLHDRMYSDLNGLELIPLANKSFQVFDEIEDDDYIYVCSKEFPRKLLPNSDSILIDLVTHRLQADLMKVAKSDDTQLVNLDENDIATLLPQCYPSEWKNRHVVKLSNENQTFPIEWFEYFWKWVQNYSLSLFKACFIIPISTKSIGQSLTATKLTARAKSSVVLISGNEYPKLMLDILKKYKVLCTMPKYVPYLMHRELHEYVNQYIPNGILNAISNTHTDVSDIELDKNEAFELQRFLASLSLSELTNSQRTVLFNLQIFEMVNNEELTSLQQASKISWNRSIIIEPPVFNFSQESLPDCLVILSQSNEKVLVNACSGSYLKVSSPKSQLTFILKEIIPLVNSKKCPESSIDLLMEQVLYLIPDLKRKYVIDPNKFRELTLKLSCLSFLKVDGSSTRKAPRDLYDPSKTELCALFQGKSVFPRQPFNKEEHLQHLRECGLQTSVKGEVILLLLTEIAIQGRHVVPQKVDKQKLSRAKAILNYIRKVPGILSEVVGKSEHLKNALKRFSLKNCWLPICATPPDDYVDNLPWKGRACTSHVVSMSESILLCSNRDLDTLPHLVGSQIYIVECPQALCKVLQTVAVPSKAVFSHFKLMIQNQRDIDSTELDQHVNLVYKHLQDNLSTLQSTYATRELCTQNIVWWKNQHKFIAPNRVVLKKHPTFDNIADLSPYYIPLPGNLSQYKRLLIHFGVQEQLTDSNIISVLRKIKEDKQRTSNEQVKRKWKTVENILNWLTNDGTENACDKLAEDDTLLVPIDSKDLLLMDVKEVVYTDLDYLKSFTHDKDSSVHFIHEKFAHLATYLGVESLSSHLNISLDAFGDVGQHEPLVTRIKNILKDYQGGLTIIKELIQNADDAGATEMTICCDNRRHSVSSKSLIFPGMAKCHGPALLVHNNATFTDEDFENITKLAGATKLNKPLKIGKFGVGFCSVYHITDVPSFISREWLYIFDPMISYLRKEIADTARPGKKVSFTEKIVQSSKQLIPYQSMFGFDQTKPYQGTLFRFPFRTSASEISGIIYNKQEVDKLLNDLLNAGSRLLLFVNNLQSITFSLIDSEDDEPKVLCSFKKSVIYRVPLADSAITHKPVRNDNCIFQIRKGNISTEKGRRLHYTSTYWLVSNYEQQQFEIGSDSDKLCFASVACLLHQENFSPQQVRGELFCSLPLSCPTGLPVHVSANFAVLTDRSGIHSSDADRSPSDQAQWNVTLMQTVVPMAYHSLLLALKQLCAVGKISISDYKYYSLWPLAANLKMHNLWDKLVSCLYQSLSESKLFYSAFRSQWVQLTDARILSLNILSTTESSLSEFVVEAAKQLGYLLIDLPSTYQACLPSAIVETCLVDEEEFLTCFFENIANVSKHDRNEVLFLTFKAFACGNEDIQQHLKSNACIPISQHEDCVKMCSDIIDPKAEFACLYDQSDCVFPVEKFYSDKYVCYSMRELGMISSQLPIPMMEERAKTLWALFFVDRNKALEKSKMILQCVTQLVKRSEQPVDLTGLVHVPFLPVMERPDCNTYPAFFQWFGQKRSLLCGKELVKGSDSAALLAGSQVCILNESSIDYGGCGHIPEDTATAIGISLYPSCDSIIKHLKHIETVYAHERDKKSLKKWIEAACREIYDHLDSQISKCQVSTDQLNELRDMNSVWTGHSFISPDLVARSWDRKGPYLYCIPHLLKNRNNLVGILKFKEEFTREDFLNALEQAYLKNNGKSISGKKEIMREVLDILHDLVYLLDKEDSNFTDNQVCYVPDTSGILRRMDELAYNDAPWCQVGKNMLFVHGDVSRDIAIRLGVTPIRSKALEQYESAEQHWGGVPFGQHEDLTQRIRNILGDYPQGITVFKELLQNADDAKATKMYIILDKRMHDTEKLPSNEWQDLQGPALLVWNDSVFSEEDLKGIQELGLGSKRSSSETIGQFGIGFNVVYHLTDCPSFFTNGETFCVLDPHCRYVPGANPLKPGRRYDGVDASFWESWSDLKSAYLHEQSMEGCPDELHNSGTLFRFPLRHSEELVQKSELICEEASRFGSSKRPLTVGEMKDDLDRWFPILKEALLFLNHVTELKLFEIDHNSSMVLTHYYATRFIIKRDANFQQKIDCFDDTREPFIDNYSVCLHECLPQKNTEEWIIQVGIGDMLNPRQHWKYLPKRKPRHGLAFPVNKDDFSGKIFCFLPLPSFSHLPVHVNGDFILDSARRGLWTSRDSPGTDERYKWNRHLLEAIASSYSKLLVSYREELFSPPPCQSSQGVEDVINKYYKLFPRWLDENKLDSDMQYLATHVYEKLSLLHSPVLIAKNDSTDGPFNIEWLPPTDAEKSYNSQQVHFWDNKSLDRNLPPILKRIGINITAAPMFVRDHFEDLGIQLPLADPATAYNYYCLYFSQVSERFPCPITETRFQSVGNFLKFINYVVKSDYLEDDDESGIFSRFPDSPAEIPLLLTSDESLRCFFEDKVICSEYAMIFAVECGDKFLHPEVYKLRLSPEYFVRPGKENWDMIANILCSILPESLKVQKVTNASEIIDIQNLLSPLWQCLVSDKVFKIHFDKIIEEWALLLTTSDELFAYKSNQQLLPIIPPTRHVQRQISQNRVIPPSYTEDTKVLQILEEHSMPVLNTEVVDRIYCQQFCPQMSEPQKILKNLVYLCSQSGLQSMMNDRCADQIAALFTYFGKIHFAREPESLKAVRSLPLFKDVRDGKYCTLSGQAYIWPDDAIMLDVGREQWIEQTSVVYLSPSGSWNNLGSSYILQLNEISPLLIYTQFIFPHFYLLSNEERIIHLKHIRDTEQLFDTAWNNRNKKDSGGGSIHKWSVDFINALKNLPCLLKNGELQPISKFCDPDVPVLGIFLGDECFPPDDLIKDSKWLQFFRKLGLRKNATEVEFITFCRRMANGNQQHIRESSWALMECLFETTRWHEDVQFLNRISAIPFVCTKHVKDLNWIVPVASTESTMQQRGNILHLTSLKKAASLEVKELIWTIKPIVELPYGMISRSEDKEKVEAFLRCIKVGRDPSIEDVVKNVKQISESRFANFNLFDLSTEDCTPSIERKELLFKVLLQCYKYLRDKGCSTEDLNCLQNAPCIPVTTTDHDFLSDSAVPVTALITPLQVVASTDTTIKQLVPFLNPLPESLFPVLSGVLSKLGVTTEIQYKHLRNALETMYQNVEQPLDPNNIKIVKLVIKKFHAIQIPPTIDKPFYLPNEQKMLAESTNLVCDDHGRYKNVHFDTRDLSYSFISLLVNRNEERSEYGFSLKDFVSSLPPAIRPLPLSVHCYEKLSPGCSIQEHSPHSDFICELKRAFTFPNFAKVIEKVLLASSVEEETCRKFTQKLTAFCSSVELSIVPNLKVDVYLTLCQPPVLIGTTKVDFAFLRNTDSDSFVICVDSGTKMKPKVLESFSKRLVSTIAVISNTSFGDLDEIVEGSVTDLLQDQSQEAIAELLGELGVRSEILGHCDSEYRPISVKLGNQISDCLNHRLHADINNIFRPQELIGYEITDNNYIFARVNYRIAEPAEEGELEKYCISISEDDEEGRIVTIIEMYKIL